MIKHLLHCMVLIAAIVCSTATAWAEHVVYAIVPASLDGAKVTSFDYDLLSTDATLELTTSGEALEGVANVLCGTNVGEKYYALIENEDPETYDLTTKFVSINYTTGNVTEINSASFGPGMPGSYACGMTYDEQSGNVYVIEQAFDENEDRVTVLYTIDVETGALTKWNSYKGLYEDITSDGQGGFYLIQYKQIGWFTYPQLYHMSSTLAIDGEPTVSNEEIGCFLNANKSFCLSEDGQHVIYTIGTTVYEFDLNAKTFSKKGDLSDSIAGLTTKCSTEDATGGAAPVVEKAERKLMSVTTYGDSMGFVPNDVDMKRDIHFYGYDDKENAIGSYGRCYDANNNPLNYEATYYARNYRDEAGNIVRTVRNQFGLYDFGDRCMEKRLEYKYEYDENNRLVKDSVENYKHFYEYDEEGNLVKVITHIAHSDMYLSTVEYSDFVALNKPQVVVSEGIFDSYTYTAYIDYDENLNKVRETRGKQIENGGLTEFVASTQEDWTYDKDVLTLYLKQRIDGATGEIVPEKKTEYVPVDGNVNKMKVTDSQYFDGKWTLGSLPRLYTYTKFDDEIREATQVEIAAFKVENSINDVKVQWTIPAKAYMSQSAFVIYRDGEVVDTVNLMDCIDYENFTCEYVDQKVKSGKHDYFVLPIFGTEELMDDEEPGEEPAPEWAFYYASDIVTVDTTVELPAATNVHVSAARTERVGEGLNVSDEIYGTIAWDMPVSAEELVNYGFISSDLMFNKMQLSDSMTDSPEVNSLEANFYFDTTDVYILTRYVYGKAFSEHITVALKDLKNLVGIQNVSTGNGTAFSIDNRQISLSGNGNATVFNTAGVRVAKNAGNSVDLTTLVPGTYILYIEENGKINGYKFYLK